MKKVLTEAQYFPSIYWFALFFYADKVIIDDTEPFRKQTFRNRALILASNKILPLIVPVHKGKSKQALAEVKIDYSLPWQRTQWRAIQSAYQSAPYFEFYKNSIREVFSEKYTNLLPLNLKTLKIAEELLAVDIFGKIEFRSEIDDVGEALDWRGAIRPKKNAFKPEEKFNTISYPQVFEEKFGFQKGLSILDLIFNAGPAAEEILRKMNDPNQEVS